jgi:predicted dehydrogenase
MGRIASAANFVETIEGSAAPLNTPQEALKLMQIIDALYKSAETGSPVAL